MTYTSVYEASEVTREILALAEFIYDEWFADGSYIDWPDLLGRLDGSTLADESTLDLGSDMLSPAILKLKVHLRKYRYRRL